MPKESPFRLRRRLRALAQTIGGARLPEGPHAVEVVDGHGERHLLQVEGGQTLLQALRAGEVDIAHYCGGTCSCGTCLVDVEGGAAGLTAMTGGEELVLGGAQVRAGQRLACQARVVGPVQLRIPGRY